MNKYGKRYIKFNGNGNSVGEFGFIVSIYGRVGLRYTLLLTVLQLTLNRTFKRITAYSLILRPLMEIVI